MYKYFLLTAISLIVLANPDISLTAERRISIATAGTAGALYPMGVAMAETINRHVDGFKATAESSSASLENIRNLAQGNVEWGISQNEVAYLAYHGKEKYENRPVTSLRSLFGTIISWAQIFTTADSSIQSIADFKGNVLGWERREVAENE